MKRLFALLPTIILLLNVNLSQATDISAAAGSDFQPGRIIDDAIFYNKDAMSVGDIQYFLSDILDGTANNGANKACDTNGDKIYSGTTLRKNARPEYPPPYICLKDYYENPTTHENNLTKADKIASPIPAGGISAAQIIYNAAQTYGINPKVLIVMIQKESVGPLLTDDWPFYYQYKTAMGYGCPDTAACDSTYFGFYNQVWNAARQYRLYTNNPNNYNYTIGLNNILYNPNAACGTKAVNITNQATANLYNYTPYVPNAAALANMYGTGDSCSAYGNRNFWRMFTDWFGSTTVPPYDYAFVSSTYSNLSLDYNQKTTSTIVIKNTGSQAWYSDSAIPIGGHPTRLALAGYATTPFADTADPNWLGTKGQIKMTPNIVLPGESATFTFNLIAPYAQITNYVQNFVPVVDGVQFMRNSNMNYLISTKKPSYAYVGASFPPAVMLPGQQSSNQVIIKNTSGADWYADGAIPAGKHPTRLATLGYSLNPYVLKSDPNWLGTQSQIKMSPELVHPGENATFTINLVAPYAAQKYLYRFLPIIDGVTFLADYGMAYSLSTPVPNYSYSFVTATNPPSIMAANSIANASITLKNTGNAVWRNEATRQYMPGLRLITSQPWYRSSPFYNNADTNWLSSAQIGMTTPTVNPGENATFNFTWKAPVTPGKYYDHIAPVIDGVALLHDMGMAYAVTVTP